MKFKGNKENKTPDKKKEEPMKKIIAYFCKLLSFIGEKEDDKTIENFCRTICLKYEWHYTDTILNYYSHSEKEIIRNITIIEDQIFEKLDNETKIKINKHIKSKNIHA